MRLLTHAAAATAFLALATLNAGGYRYGASDQAFYIPAILKQLDPVPVPARHRADRAPGPLLLHRRNRRRPRPSSGWSIEACFATGYVPPRGHHLRGRFGGSGISCSGAPLATWALLAAETLRHRITKTGVNTLEGYFHPRILVFAVGVWAITAYLRGRPRLALGAVLLAGLLHPTTAAFFVCSCSPAIWVTEPRARRIVGTAITARPDRSLLAAARRTAARVALARWTPNGATCWTSKDYLFPVRDWDARSLDRQPGHRGPRHGALAHRVARGPASPREQGLLAGAVVLIAGFLVTLPAVTAGSAFFVQLQISRVFWILDLLGVVSVLWLAARA